MSYGTICLTCRHYITDAEWGCKCEQPVPSDDGRTPNEPAPAAARKEDGRREAASA